MAESGNPIEEAACKNQFKLTRHLAVLIMYQFPEVLPMGNSIEHKRVQS